MLRNITIRNAFQFIDIKLTLFKIMLFAKPYIIKHIHFQTLTYFAFSISVNYVALKQCTFFILNSIVILQIHCKQTNVPHIV